MSEPTAHLIMRTKIERTGIPATADDLILICALTLKNSLF